MISMYICPVGRSRVMARALVRRLQSLIEVEDISSRLQPTNQPRAAEQAPHVLRRAVMLIGTSAFHPC